LPRSEDDPVSIERHGDHVTIEVGGGPTPERRDCIVEGLTERIGIALLGAAGTTIRNLGIARLGD
jgi:hypothetical protein